MRKPQRLRRRKGPPTISAAVFGIQPEQTWVEHRVSTDSNAAGESSRLRRRSAIHLDFSTKLDLAFPETLRFHVRDGPKSGLKTRIIRGKIRDTVFKFEAPKFELSTFRERLGCETVLSNFSAPLDVVPRHQLLPTSLEGGLETALLFPAVSFCGNQLGAQNNLPPSVSCRKIGAT